jgi:hypothetical protein
MISLAQLQSLSRRRRAVNDTAMAELWRCIDGVRVYDEALLAIDDIQADLMQGAATISRYADLLKVSRRSNIMGDYGSVSRPQYDMAEQNAHYVRLRESGRRQLIRPSRNARSM